MVVCLMISLSAGFWNFRAQKLGQRFNYRPEDQDLISSFFLLDEKKVRLF